MAFSSRARSARSFALFPPLSNGWRLAWKGFDCMVLPETYIELNQILSLQYDTVNGYDFYRFIFPDNENEGDQHSDFSHPNAIYLYKDERDTGTKRRLRRRVMLNDTWERDYMEFVEQNPLTLCSGLSYRSRANRIENAQRMNALIFDLDGVGEKELKTLFLRFGRPPGTIRSLPVPTFLVLSGTGLHLYYVFDTPVDLYPNIKVQLKALKYDLTFRIWEYKSTSAREQIEYQSINQGFRMVGSVNQKYGTEIKAFRVGDKVSLDELNQYATDSKNKVDIARPFQPSKMTRAAAKEAYPEWYQRVVVEKKKRLKKWDIKGKQGYALYDWWIRQIGNVRGGHRYYFLMCLAIYACKCDVPYRKLKADMYEVYEELRLIEHDNPLTVDDIESALEAYDKEYYNFTIADIEKLTDIRIKRNKRNGRKQVEHLKRARAVQNVDYPNGEWREGNGRPKGSSIAEQSIREYMQAHLEAKKKEIKDALGVSYPTIRKYYDKIKQEIATEAEAAVLL